MLFTPGLTEAGGAARRSRLLAVELARRGWDVRVVTRAGTQRRFSSLKAPGLYALEVPGFGAPRLGGLLFLVVAIPLGITWGIRSIAFLSIQITSQTTAASVCGKLLRKPYFAFLTTGGPVSEVAHVQRGGLARVRAWIINGSRCLVAQTSEAASQLQAAFSGVDVVVIPNPVAHATVYPLTGQPRALFVGRLSEEKDLFRLVRVWRNVALEDAAARLTIAGAGGSYRSVEEELRDLVRDDEVLRGSVEFVGWVDDVAKLWEKCDVFVFPSTSEGMSNALLEACATGRVVVASDIPANQAVVGPNHPLTFHVSDEGSMEECLRKGLYDEEARGRSVANTAARIREFSLERFVDQVEGLLNAADRPRH